MKRENIKIRWLTTTGFEVVLPNGKVILFDPWLGKSDYPEMNMDLNLNIEDLTGADYIFISHIHFDHAEDVAAIADHFKKDTYGGRIYCPALSCKAFADYYDIPYREIIPSFPGEIFETDDFTVEILPCRHLGDEGAPIGPRPSTNIARAKERGADDYEILSGALGSLEEMDLAITIKESGFRFMFLGGRLYRFNNIYEKCKTFYPNFVIRQLSPGFSPQVYAKICKNYNAPIIFPSHHDSHHLEKVRNTTYEKYFNEVNEELIKMNSSTRVINIERLKWYEIGVYCCELK
ncbi:MAG: MBL fold metallo-hydrolase [Erysipelotrichaceae bacterium]|jgi:hypothetical protein